MKLFTKAIRDKNAEERHPPSRGGGILTRNPWSNSLHRTAPPTWLLYRA